MNEISAAGADLTTCDREPIHIPGSIQPHGLLFVVDPDRLTVLSASANTVAWLGLDPSEIVDKPVAALFKPMQTERIESGLRDASLERNPLYLETLATAQGAKSFHAIAHRHQGRVILELEPAPNGEQLAFRDLYPLARTFVASLHNAPDVSELARRAAGQVRRVTCFDRVLVYRFEPDWTGVVIAEDSNGRLPSYLGLRFPASDIPRQARELYRLNRLRLIPDAGYRAVPLVSSLDSGTNPPVDLTYSLLRSVSPVHLEYMRNMGTASSMSISILRENQLWGLISCHSAEPQSASFEVRTACDLLGQMLALEISDTQERNTIGERLRLKVVETRLLTYMGEQANFIAGLSRHPDDLLALVNASGAAVLFQGLCQLVGSTPAEQEVRDLAAWLATDDVFVSDSLSEQYPAARDMTDRAAGVMAIAISKIHSSYVLWFRPEMIRTVHWAGQTDKSAEGEGNSPRKSFEAWQQQVRGRSAPWSDAEIESAKELRNGIIGTVLRRAEEMAELSAELKRSNQELEAFSYSVSHDLRAPFRHISGYAELLRDGDIATLSATAQRYVDNIIDSARFAGLLVDNLLSFSQIGRASLNLTAVDMNHLVREVREDVSIEEGAGRYVNWTVGALPVVQGDVVLLRQVLRNLLSNALKYTRGRDPARIEISAEKAEMETIFWVKDNGAGFDMAYADKLFGVFERLHRMEEFEGTGIGLAIVRRIVGRHGGRTWAESAPQQGAAFYFSIPEQAPEKELA